MSIYPGKHFFSKKIRVAQGGTRTHETLISMLAEIDEMYMKSQLVG